MTLRVHHIEINSRSLSASLPFYTHLFTTHFGLSLSFSNATIATFEGAPGTPYICICQAKTNAGSEFDRYAPGLNHLAFSLPTQLKVDSVRNDLHTGELKRLGGMELDEVEYPFAGGPNHYALFFLGPVDGFKFEVVWDE